MSSGLGARGFENKMWECYTAKKLFANSLLEDTKALKAGNKLDSGVAVHRRLGSAAKKRQSASGRHKGPKSDEGWKSGRQVGAVEE